MFNIAICRTLNVFHCCHCFHRTDLQVEMAATLLVEATSVVAEAAGKEEWGGQDCQGKTREAEGVVEARVLPTWAAEE
jgi:hypothetical protein